MSRSSVLQLGGNGGNPRDGASQPRLPETIHDKIVEFMLDRKTGNLTLNVKDGRILSVKVEEIVRS